MPSQKQTHASLAERQVIRALLVAALASVGLSVAKFIAFIFTGSLVALGSFFDSLGDAVISFINALAYKHARKIPDREHPFGHGGIEVLSSFLQGGFLGGLALILIYYSFMRLLGLEKADEIDRQSIPLAIAILLGSAAVGLIINWVLNRSRNKSSEVQLRSLALDADRAHYAGDALANLLSAAGLGVVWYTGAQAVDAAMGLVSAAFILKLSLPILKRCAADITHREVHADVQEVIRQLVLSVDPRVFGMHRLRTRELGPTLFIDFHIVLPRDILLEDAHAIAECAANRLRKKFPRADVLIHLDPDSEPPEEIGS